MKFQPDALDGVNVIARLEPGRIWVHQTPFQSSLLVPWRGEVEAWPAQAPGELTAEHFGRLLAWSPELVVFGSGERQRFVHPSLYSALIERRIGIETMDTAAAARTFNVLVTEGRRVLGAFLLPPA
ncbi:Mth938-like domain-containing protein [Ideonella alba]|uniref:Xcc1710-like domain-containing protein n=1 Tax=Ideonella alba TaxID=2824118 RepID=A0A941BFQ3_9BURK|nr:MTH938/NDUFAF3 family protein [Ideonella alba]MBQ0931292.1 hypothetical protein [Ideonella alba]